MQFPEWWKNEEERMTSMGQKDTTTGIKVERGQNGFPLSQPWSKIGRILKIEVGADSEDVNSKFNQDMRYDYIKTEMNKKLKQRIMWI